MAMSESDRATVRFWCGTLTGDGWTQAEESMARLGSAYAVALELLNIRLSDFTFEIADLASASDRSNHARNIDAIRTRIDELVTVVANTPDLSLSTAGQALFDQATAGSPAALVSVPVQYRNPRLT